MRIYRSGIRQNSIFQRGFLAKPTTAGVKPSAARVRGSKMYKKFTALLGTSVLALGLGVMPSCSVAMQESPKEETKQAEKQESEKQATEKLSLIHI